MPSYKLTYFNARGVAEPSRIILAYNGVEFEDVRVEREQWPAMKDSEYTASRAFVIAMRPVELRACTVAISFESVMFEGLAHLALTFYYKGLNDWRIIDYTNISINWYRNVKEYLVIDLYIKSFEKGL